MNRVKRRLLSLMTATVVSAGCSAPPSEEGLDQPASSSKPGVTGEQSDEGKAYGYGPCAEEPLIGRVGFPGEKPILVKKSGPDRGLRDEIERFVVVRAIVDREGNVCSATVVRSLGPEADRAAVDAVKQWRFEPATLDGEPWPVEMHLTVEFPSGSPD